MSSTTPHQIYTDDDYYLLKSQYDRLLDLVNPIATGDWEYDLDTTREGIQRMERGMRTLEDQIREFKEGVKELKEEVEELQEIEDSTLFEKLYDSHLYEDWVEGSTLYEELKEENETLKAENQKLQSDEYIHQILYENMDDAIANQVEAQVEEYISGLNQVETSGDWYMSKLVSS